MHPYCPRRSEWSVTARNLRSALLAMAQGRGRLPPRVDGCEGRVPPARAHAGGLGVVVHEVPAALVKGAVEGLAQGPPASKGRHREGGAAAAAAAASAAVAATGVAALRRSGPSATRRAQRTAMDPGPPERRTRAARRDAAAAVQEPVQRVGAPGMSSRAVGSSRSSRNHSPSCAGAVKRRL